MGELSFAEDPDFATWIDEDVGDDNGDEADATSENEYVSVGTLEVLDSGDEDGYTEDMEILQDLSDGSYFYWTGPKDENGDQPFEALNELEQLHAIVWNDGHGFENLHGYYDAFVDDE